MEEAVGLIFEAPGGAIRRRKLSLGNIIVRSSGLLRGIHS